MSLAEASFQQAYGRDLQEALEWVKVITNICKTEGFRATKEPVGHLICLKRGICITLYVISMVAIDIVGIQSD